MRNKFAWQFKIRETFTQSLTKTDYKKKIVRFFCLIHVQGQSFCQGQRSELCENKTHRFRSTIFAQSIEYENVIYIYIYMSYIYVLQKRCPVLWLYCQMFRLFICFDGFCLLWLWCFYTVLLYYIIVFYIHFIEIVQYICVMEASALTLWCLTPLSTILQFGNIRFNIILRFLVRFVLQNL